MKPNSSEMERAAWDARVKLNSEETNELLEHSRLVFEQLDSIPESELDTLQATCYGHSQPNTVREDTEEASLPLSLSLGNAPDADESCFRVPRIIEE